jgi:hypothetical protein
VVEALTPEFGEVFWRFILAGGYAIRQVANTAKPIFYRFEKPTDERFPQMLELFSRTPEGITLVNGSQLTPIPIDEAVSSLSAILLDESYYGFILEGRRILEGLACVVEDRLIPLKARAWLDLTARRNGGEKIDSGNIKKHLNDVLRLSQLLNSTTRIAIPESIAEDLRLFLRTIEAEGSIDLKALRIRASLLEIIQRLTETYGLNRS